MRQINRDFRFDKKATEVTTPVEAFFQKRRGVCQDFAHLQIACLRSLGLPARYVSGYLRTFPAAWPATLGRRGCFTCVVFGVVPGRLVGSISTLRTIAFPTEGHITVAWGRDYSDVSPIHGVLLGGAKHTLDVGVDVTPIQ